MMKLLAAVIIMLGMLLVPALSVSAVDPFRDVCYGEAADSAACNARTSSNPIVGPDGTLTRVIQIVVMITGVAAVIMIIVGGFKYIISAGDSSNINSAKNTILYAVIGLVVAIFGQFIVSFVLSRV